MQIHIELLLDMDGNDVTEFPFLNLMDLTGFTSTFFLQGLIRNSNSLYVAPIVMVQYLMDIFDSMSITCY